MTPNRVVEVPIDYDPRAISGEGHSANDARVAMTEMHSAWMKIREAAADTTVDLPRLAKAAQAAMERALTVSDATTQRITSQVRHLEKEIVEATQPRLDPTLAAEVRAFWRGREWTQGMAEAVSVDVRTASAILSAPGYLSGLDDRQRDVIRQVAVKAHAADKQAALDEARGALDKVSRAGSRMVELVAPRIRDWTPKASTSLAALEAMGRG